MMNYHIIESEAIFMNTKISLDVVFPLGVKNDIYDFEFFTKYGEDADGLFISIYVVPKYSIDEQKVRNIKTTYVLEREIIQGEILGILSLLKELENTVNDFTSTTEELSKKYYDTIHRYFHVFGRP